MYISDAAGLYGLYNAVLYKGRVRIKSFSVITCQDMFFTTSTQKSAARGNKVHLSLR